jgi:hypothetical protein
MPRKDLAILISIDVLIVTTVLVAYLNGAFVDANHVWVGLAVGLPIVFNVAYFSQQSGVRFLRSEEPLSIVPSQESRNDAFYTEPTFVRRTAPAISRRKIAIGEFSVIALVLLAAIVEHLVGNVPFRYIGPITMLGLAVTLTSFSLGGNFWQPKWADADPGINLIRCVIMRGEPRAEIALLLHPTSVRP